MRTSAAFSFIFLLFLLINPNSAVQDNSFSVVLGADSGVTTSATGTANVEFNSGFTAFTVYVQITTMPASAITACHIHYATTAGVVPGSPVYNLTTSTGGCAPETTFNVNTWNTGYTGYPVASGGDGVGLSGGYYYVNVHTVTNPGGEIFGFLQYAPWSNPLGALPAVTTSAAGITNVVVNSGNTAFTVYVTISTAPLSAITACHIHYTTTAGVMPGSPVYNMTSNNAGGCNAETTFNINTWNTGYTGVPVANGGDVAGLNGNFYYVNIHTVTNPGGEIFAFLTPQNPPSSPSASPTLSPSSATGIRPVAVFLLFALTFLLY